MRILKSYIRNRWAYQYIRIFHRIFFLIRPKISRQLKLTISNREKSANRPRILIPLIETSHYQYYQILIIAKALELRGACVKILLCNSELDGCEIKSIKNNKNTPCLECKMNSKYLLPVFNLDTINLSDLCNLGEKVQLRSLSIEIANNYPKSFFYKSIEIIPTVNDSVTRYFYGAVPKDDTSTLIKIRKKFIYSMLLGIECSLRIQKEWNPDIVFGSMNVYVDWAPYHKMQENLGKRVCTVSITPFNYHSIVLNTNELYSGPSRFNRWMEDRNYQELNDYETSELRSISSARSSGNIEAFKRFKFFDNSKSLESILNIDITKKNLFLFTNIYWDVGISESGRLYEGVIDWVLDSIRMVIDQPDICLYIKTHPAEVYDTSVSLKGIRDFIHEVFPILPDNVILIYPELKINTYELFPFIDVGIVYNGTVGLEMALNQIPVISTGKSPYSGIGLVNEPNDTKSYREQMLYGTTLFIPNQRLAELFSYFYFIKSCIPWNLTESAYSDDFKSFKLKSLDDLMEGKNSHLDHLCKAIFDPAFKSPESWI
jgi:hypothetical protein